MDERELLASSLRRLVYERNTDDVLALAHHGRKTLVASLRGLVREQTPKAPQFAYLRASFTLGLEMRK
jgi:hypothetical protein